MSLSFRPSPSPSDQAPAWLDRGRIPGLDGLRAVAILLVLYAHVACPGDGWLPLRTLKGRCGFLGVQLFFVLSGFLITTLMLREVGRTGRLSLGGFYLRRVLRIVPAYLAYLAVLVVLQATGRANLDARAWCALGTYTVNFLPTLPGTIAHVWSLSVEEHFYLLWPLLMAGLTPLGCRRAALVCLGGALAVRWLVLFFLPAEHSPIDVWSFTRLDDIAVGCLLAFAARDAAWRRRLSELTSNRQAMLLLAAVFLASQVCFSRMVGGRLFPPLVLNVVLGLANDVNSLSLAVLMWAVLSQREGVVRRVLNAQFLGFVGVISYSLYLWHPLFCLRGSGLTGVFPLNFACIFATGLLSYYLVERPFLSLKDWLTERQPVPGTTARPPQRRVRAKTSSSLPEPVTTASRSSSQ